MKKFCKIKKREVETSRVPLEKKLPSTGETVVTGHQLHCNEKVYCRENCALIDNKAGIDPFDE